MDIQVMLEQIKGHVNGFTVTVLVLFIASEVLGSNDKIKASSLYGLARTLLATLKDQVWPVNMVTAEPAPAAQLVQPPAQ